MTKQVIRLNAEQSIREAAAVLFREGISGAPVVDEAGRLVGMLSEKDIFKALYPSYEELHSQGSLMEFIQTEEWGGRAHEVGVRSVKSLMKTRVILCEPSDSIVRVGALMLASSIHRLPVVKDGKIVGIVDRADIFHTAMRKEFELDLKPSTYRRSGVRSREKLKTVV